MTLKTAENMQELENAIYSAVSSRRRALEILISAYVATLDDAAFAEEFLQYVEEDETYD